MKGIISTGIFLFLLIPAIAGADSIRNEVNVSYSRNHTESSTTTMPAVGIVHYLKNLAIGQAPYGLESFVQQAGYISLNSGHINTWQSEINRHGDGYRLQAGGRFISEQYPVIFEAAYDHMQTDSDEFYSIEHWDSSDTRRDIKVGVGAYIGNTTDIVITAGNTLSRFSERYHTEASPESQYSSITDRLKSLSARITTVTQLNTHWMKLSAELATTESGDSSPNVNYKTASLGADYYLRQGLYAGIFMSRLYGDNGYSGVVYNNHRVTGGYYFTPETGLKVSTERQSSDNRKNTWQSMLSLSSRF